MHGLEVWLRKVSAQAIIRCKDFGHNQPASEACGRRPKCLRSKQTAPAEKRFRDVTVRGESPTSLAGMVRCGGMPANREVRAGLTLQP